MVRYIAYFIVSFFVAYAFKLLLQFINDNLLAKTYRMKLEDNYNCIEDLDISIEEKQFSQFLVNYLGFNDGLRYKVTYKYIVDDKEYTYKEVYKDKEKIVDKLYYIKNPRQVVTDPEQFYTFHTKWIQYIIIAVITLLIAIFLITR